MKKIPPYKILFCLACICIFLPWFSWNPKVTGYCWGFDFILELALPMLIISFCIFSGGGSVWLAVLTEIFAIAMVAVVILAAGTWQQVFNISGGLKFSMRPILPTYRFSLAVYVLLFAALQVRIFRKSGRFG